MGGNTIEEYLDAWGSRVFGGKGKMLSSGATVPTDATAGYFKGCLFLHTDGGTSTIWYQNIGTLASCDFDAITNA